MSTRPRLCYNYDSSAGHSDWNFNSFNTPSSIWGGWCYLNTDKISFNSTTQNNKIEHITAGLSDSTLKYAILFPA